MKVLSKGKVAIGTDLQRSWCITSGVVDTRSGVCFLVGGLLWNGIGLIERLRDRWVTSCHVEVRR
jgi:hypothetical protein